MQDNEPKKKYKAGLHKEISSIFKGVPIPGKDIAQQPSGPATEGREEQGPAGEPSPPMAKPGPARQPIPKKTIGKSRLQKTWQKILNKLLKSKEGVSSSRQKIMLVLVPVLFVVLLFVLMPLFKSPSRKILESQRAKPTKVATKPGREIDWQIPEPYPTGIRDPMQPGSPTVTVTEGERIGTIKTANGRLARLPVKGIVYSKDNPAAIVGTQLVHEGDMISDVTIVKINENSVEFKINSKIWIQRVE